MKSILVKVLAAAVIVLGTSHQAQALTITPATAACVAVPACLAASGNQTSQSEINVAIAGILGSAGLLYKQDVGGPESGSFGSSYQTSFSNTPTDPSGALIQYVGGAAISSNPAYLLVKDGNATPAWYLYTLTGWNGTESIQLENFWPGKGAISHVTIYGTTQSVPEGGSVTILLGIGLMGLAAFRRLIA